MSNLAPPPTDPPLTPNTLTAAEEALRFNEALQTASAGAPQPTTPAVSRRTSNYAAAAAHSGLNAGAPYPASFRARSSTDSGTSTAHDDDADDDAAAAPAFEAFEPGKLSRGTTQAVLEKMASHEFVAGGTLARRLGRAAERPAAEGGPERADGVPRAGAKPGFDRQVSWSAEDRKRAMTQGLMRPVGENESAGYSSAGGEA